MKDNLNRWITITEYVDIETGEIITKKIATTNYIIIKKTKHAQFQNKTGIITWTNQCKRSQQTKLF